MGHEKGSWESGSLTMDWEWGEVGVVFVFRSPNRLKTNESNNCSLLNQDTLGKRSSIFHWILRIGFYQFAGLNL